MDEQVQNSRFRRTGLIASICFIGLTQIPGTINETLKLGCVLSTWADYASFWRWNEIPLDARVRYCNGGNIGNIDNESKLDK